MPFPVCMVRIYTLELNSEIFLDTAYCRYQELSVYLRLCTWVCSCLPLLINVLSFTLSAQGYLPRVRECSCHSFCWTCHHFRHLSQIRQRSFYKYCHLKASKQNIISALLRVVGDLNRLEIRCWNLHSNKNSDEYWLLNSRKRMWTQRRKMNLELWEVTAIIQNFQGQELSSEEPACMKCTRCS